MAPNARGAVLVTLIVASIITKDWSATGGLIGAGMGALATALNAPTGIGNAIRSVTTTKAQ